MKNRIEDRNRRQDKKQISLIRVQTIDFIKIVLVEIAEAMI